MNRFVLDASVAAKWLPIFRHEPLTKEAQAIANEWVTGNVQLYVPDLFWPEMANILWKATRLGLCQPPEAAAALDALQQQNFPTISSANIIRNALTIATKHSRTAYDCVYVSLAIHLNAQLLTADEKLANSLAAYFPVKFLAAI